jgi:hypothetical protein
MRALAVLFAVVGFAGAAVGVTADGLWAAAGTSVFWGSSASALVVLFSGNLAQGGPIPGEPGTSGS